MNIDFSRCLAFTIKEESCEWSGDKNDGGNWTGGAPGAGTFIGSKYGVSAYILRAWRIKNKLSSPTQHDMQTLRYSDAKTIAFEEFWLPVNGDKLPSGLDLTVFDFGYNASPERSCKLLQSVLGVTSDGIIGPDTLKAITSNSMGYDNIGSACMPYLLNYPDPTHIQVLITKVCSSQYDYYDSIGSKLYTKGWLDRCLSRLKTSLSLGAQNNESA